MRICVVDKHDIVRQNIEHFLTDRDHEVVALTSLEEVLERLANQEGPVDLVIADFPAEDPQCLALLRRVHEQQPQVPCVAMTNAGRIAPAEEAVACGVQAYIHKPVRLAELDFVLRRIGERGSSTNTDRPACCLVVAVGLLVPARSHSRKFFEKVLKWNAIWPTKVVNAEIPC